MCSALVARKHFCACAHAGTLLGRRKHSSFPVVDPDDLLHARTPANSTTHASLLRCFGIAGALLDGRRVHSSLISHGLEHDSFLGNLLVQMYARCLDMESVQFCFHRLDSRNVFSWNFLMGALDVLGQYNKVLLCFVQMQAEDVIPDAVTFIHVFSAYTSNPVNLQQGKWLHACIICAGLDSNCIVATGLVNMYGKSSEWKLAWSTFIGMPEQDLASWNAFIALCVLQGQYEKALHIYDQLHQESFLPDNITLVNMLTALTTPAALTYGKQMHALTQHEQLEKNTILGTAFVNMYGKCSCLRQAQFVFETMSIRNVVTWNSMIMVYAQHCHAEAAMQLFQRMQQEGVAINCATFVGLLDACASERLLATGRTLHIWVAKYGYESDIMVGTALVNMYNKSVCIREGQVLFEMLPVRSIVSWNAMITGHVHLGQGKEALEIFDRMQKEKVTMDNMTASLALSACALEASLARGKGVHSAVLQHGFDFDLAVMNSLLNMYGKCGCVRATQAVFDIMLQKNLVSWNCLMALQTQHGHWIDVFELLREMQLLGIVPDETTLTSLISACSHAGRVHECLCMFHIISDHNLCPSIDHFDCMVDLVSRAGQLDEAEYFVSCMPIQPRALSWTTLLAACKCSANVSMGQFAARSRLELEVGDLSTYMKLLNIYSVSGMKENGVKLMDCFLAEELGLQGLPAIRVSN